MFSFYRVLNFVGLVLRTCLGVFILEVMLFLFVWQAMIDLFAAYMGNLIWVAAFSDLGGFVIMLH